MASLVAASSGLITGISTNTSKLITSTRGSCCRSRPLSCSSSGSLSGSSLRRAAGPHGRKVLPVPNGLGQGLNPSPLSRPALTPLPTLPAYLPTPSTQRRPANPPSHVTYAGRGGGDTVDATERILASVGYILPFLDGAKYGRYLYLQYPFVRTLLDPVVPAIQLYNGLPFAGFIAFFALYLGIIQNQNMSRYVRYNVMQAVILDILMILPALLERVFTFRDGVGFQITIVCYNTVFLYLVACTLFGIGSCLLGRNPRLPLVADAAEAQVPF